MTTHTTRRTILAGLALAPIAGVPVIAGAVVGDDPIFAAFAEHERARAAETLAWKATEDLSEAAQAAKAAAGMGDAKILTRRRIEDIHKMGLYSSSEYEAALTALEADKSEFQKMAVAIEESEAAAECVRDATNETEVAIFETTPTTRAGAVKLLRHIADFLDEDDVINDMLVGDLIGDSIRNAVAVLEREDLRP